MSHLKVIGRGHFTTAYRKDRNTVILKSRDNVKECMSLGWFPETHLFPNITRVASQDQDGFSMYEMKYIDRVKAPKKQLTTKHYNLYLVFLTLDITYIRGANPLIELLGELRIKRSVKDHLIDAVSALTNYGSDIRFEISPRNIGVSKTGKLILMDVFFFKSELSWNKYNK